MKKSPVVFTDTSIFTPELDTSHRPHQISGTQGSLLGWQLDLADHLFLSLSNQGHFLSEERLKVNDIIQEFLSLTKFRFGSPCIQVLVLTHADISYNSASNQDNIKKCLDTGCLFYCEKVVTSYSCYQDYRFGLSLKFLEEFKNLETSKHTLFLKKVVDKMETAIEEIKLKKKFKESSFKFIKRMNSAYDKHRIDLTKIRLEYLILISLKLILMS